MKYLAILFLAVTVSMAAQTAPIPPLNQTVPTLSTADRIALQSCEKQKQDAQTSFNQAQQSENAVVSEWNAEHKGYHLNPQTLEVQKDAAPVEAKVPEPAKK